MAGIDPRIVRQPRELSGERVVQRIRMPAAVAVARAGIEERVPAKESTLRRMCQQTDVRHRVARRIQAFQLHCAADADYVTLAEPAIHAADAPRRGRVSQYLRSRGAGEADVSARVVPVLVRVEDLRDLPAFGF